MVLSRSCPRFSRGALIPRRSQSPSNIRFACGRIVPSAFAFLGGLYNAPDQPAGEHSHFGRHRISCLLRLDLRRARCCCSSLLLVKSFSQALSAQNDQQQPPEASQTLKVQTNLVNVFATVRDKKNGIITDLKQDDFKISEDGVEQKIAYFNKDTNLPITLAILMDTSGSMQNILGAEQDAASRFVRTVMRSNKDEAVVISFDFDVNLLADFTEDPEVLEEGIHRARISAVSAGGVVTPGTIPTQMPAAPTSMTPSIWLVMMSSPPKPGAKPWWFSRTPKTLAAR